MSRADAFAPLAQTVRSGRPESTHFGVVVALGHDGAIAFHAGDPTVAIYPRSSNKPLQAVTMVELGLSLPPELLALVCSSHDGSPMHCDGVRTILATAGLDERVLMNTPDLPIDVASAEAILRDGGGRTSLQMNCSGKHAGMVVTCMINGWPIESYLDEDHPLQQAITARLPSLYDEPVGGIGVDGCGAPAHVMTPLGLARAFRAVATGAAGSAGDEVARAMRQNPVMAGGEHRDVTAFMRAVPGLVAKDGAEGVFAAALPDGRAVALKVADGTNRARPIVMVAALEALGVDVGQVAPLVRQRVMGHGRAVGDVEMITTLGGGDG